MARRFRYPLEAAFTHAKLLEGAALRRVAESDLAAAAVGTFDAAGRRIALPAGLFAIASDALTIARERSRRALGEALERRVWRIRLERDRSRRQDLHRRECARLDDLEREEWAAATPGPFRSDFEKVLA